MSTLNKSSSDINRSCLSVYYIFAYIATRLRLVQCLHLAVDPSGLLPSGIPSADRFADGDGWQDDLTCSSSLLSGLCVVGLSWNDDKLPWLDGSVKLRYGTKTCSFLGPNYFLDVPLNQSFSLFR